jgi:ubiquinone/menaquinone biosynthesis C-methylase UbiE
MNDRVFRPSRAHKLEDPERLLWLPPRDVVHALHLVAGMTVADIGAGTGYFSIPIANAVTDSGHVFAVDLQPEMLDLLRHKLHDRKELNNISLHQGNASGLPLDHGSIDLVFFANVWHEISDLDRAFDEALRVSRPEGRIAILDWRPDCVPPPGPPLDHRISADSVSAFLAGKRCRNISDTLIGEYTYLLMADFPSRS